MLNINQKHIILGLPIYLYWKIQSRYNFCLMYFQMSNWMFWRNWKLVATQGKRTIETHNETYFLRDRQIKVKLYKFRWYGIIRVESLEAKLSNTFTEVDIQPVKTNEFKVEIEQFKLKEKSSMKVNTADFKMNTVPNNVRFNLKSLRFKGLSD
jgi:hypothetical protein